MLMALRLLNACRQRTKNGSMVLQTACEALESLSSNSQASKRKIAEAGGISALVKATNAFPESASLVESAFRLMQALVNSNRRDAMAASREFVSEHGGKTILLSAMSTHLQEETVQVAACGVMSFLAFESTSADNTQDGQLVHALLVAMKTHSDSAAVQSACVEALLEVATHVPAVRTRIKNRDTSKLLMHAKTVDERTTEDVDELLKLSQ